MFTFGVLYRFPNLAVFLITRDSVRLAYKGGITAAQIVRFLRMHAHSKQVDEKNKHNSPVIPPTVVDQVMLWEGERNRFSFTDGVLYNQFLSVADFETVRSYAENIGVLVWANPQKRTVVVSKEGHDSVKKFWKEQSKK